MRLGGFSVTVALSLLAAVAAGVCYVRADHLRTEAGWLMARGKAHADAYAQSFDAPLAESQLSTFEERRVVLERSHNWKRMQLVLTLLCVVLAISSYVLYLLKRLDEQLLGTSPAASFEDG